MRQGIEQQIYQLAIWLCLSSIIGCAANRSKPSADLKQPVEIQGFHFMPPQGDDWSLEETSKKNLYSYVKRLPDVSASSGIHTVIFAAQYGQYDNPDQSPDALLKEAEQGKITQLQSKRFRLIKNSSTHMTFREASCFRYASEAEDRQIPERSTYPYFVRINGVFCLHPDRSGRFIDLSYSQRFVGPRQPLELTKEGDAFVGSLVFAIKPWELISLAREQMYQKKRLSLARQMLNVALTKTQAEKDLYTTAVIYGDLGISAMRGKSATKKAEGFYRQAIKINLEKGYRYLLSENYYNLAGVFQLRKKRKMACDQLQKVKPLVLDLLAKPSAVPTGAEADQVTNITTAVNQFAAEIKCPKATISLP